jgi:hypothetical protein
MKSLNLASFAEKPLDYSVYGSVFGAFGGSIAKNFHGSPAQKNIEIRVTREKIGPQRRESPILVGFLKAFKPSADPLMA